MALGTTLLHSLCIPVDCSLAVDWEYAGAKSYIGSCEPRARAARAFATTPSRRPFNPPGSDNPGMGRQPTGLSARSLTTSCCIGSGEGLSVKMNVSKIFAGEISLQSMSDSWNLRPLSPGARAASPRKQCILFCGKCALRIFHKIKYSRRAPQARASNRDGNQTHSQITPLETI